MVFIGIILMVLLFGTIVGAVVWQIKKTDPSKADTSIRKDIDTAQEFLPFEDIQDSMVFLGNHQYRAYIEVSSINYNLKTEKERKIIEFSFQRFLNSLTYPITLYVHTQTMDNSNQLEALRADMDKTLKDFSNSPKIELLREYSDIYYQEFANIYERIGNTKQKKKYIVVPFDEAAELTNMSDEEKYSYVVKEMYNRCQMIMDNLSTMGLMSHILNSSEVIELATSIYHRTNHAHVEGITSGEFTSLIVTGENYEESASDNEKLDSVLVEALRRIETEFNNNINTDNSQGVEDVRIVLSQLRKHINHE